MNPYAPPSIPSDAPPAEAVTKADAFAMGFAVGLWVCLVFIAWVQWWASGVVK